VPISKPGPQVAIAGARGVGASTAYAFLIRELVSGIVLIDVNVQRVRGEAMYLAHNGVPCAMTRTAVTRVLDLPLEPEQLEVLRASAPVIRQTITSAGP
jgi:malate/lactate dehydrogenase